MSTIKELVNEFKVRPKRQWADKYGAQWYLHRDGTPPRDDDFDYVWRGSQWVKLDDDMN